MTDWRYVCSECGHGEHLSAAAEAVAFGPLAPDGCLARHDDVSDDIVHESSIQCSVHEAAPWYKRIDGVLRAWMNCTNERCFAGLVRSGRWRDEEACPTCKGAAGWWTESPVDNGRQSRPL